MVIKQTKRLYIVYSSFRATYESRRFKIASDEYSAI